jgi:hypothetical protein
VSGVFICLFFETNVLEVYHLNPSLSRLLTKEKGDGSWTMLTLNAQG